ncbi:hypothetical protein MKK68_02025 [Methylobacterium sp. E-016]|uniref:hypothetical protein n=1 Tax=Methylobacterium sp. E-016 TaxID=2836556 RepID=UPI001FBA2199|nr:hypothetical protein [Methylobacterium sp. E-016]MCJ2074440.1 hypothetical protein [Methylobacterium sp. E-016]
MTEDNSRPSSGIGFSSLLGILFIGLKLTGYIDWSWWWVLAPLWGPVAIVILVQTIGGLGYLLSKLGDRELRRIRRDRRSGKSS